MNWLEFSSNLIGDLAWPLVAITALLIFRKSMQEAVSKLTEKGSGHLEGWGVIAKWDEIVTRTEAVNTATSVEHQPIGEPALPEKPEYESDAPSLEQRILGAQSLLTSSEHSLARSIAEWISGYAGMEGRELVEPATIALGRTLWTFVYSSEAPPEPISPFQLGPLVSLALKTNRLSKASADALEDVRKMLHLINAGTIQMTHGRAVDFMQAAARANTFVARDTQRDSGKE